MKVGILPSPAHTNFGLMVSPTFCFVNDMPEVTGVSIMDKLDVFTKFVGQTINGHHADRFNDDYIVVLESREVFYKLQHKDGEHTGVTQLEATDLINALAEAGARVKEPDEVAEASSSQVAPRAAWPFPTGEKP